MEPDAGFYAGAIHESPLRSFHFHSHLHSHSFPDAELAENPLQEVFGRGIWSAEFSDLAAVHVGVGVDLHFLKTLRLDFSRRLDPRQNLRRRFTTFRGCEILVLNRRHFHVNVDPVHQGARDLGSIALNLKMGAAALSLRVPEESAGAGIHCRGKHEVCRELERQF